MHNQARHSCLPLLMASAEFTEMSSAVETLKGAEGTIFRDRDGTQRPLLLLPHLTDEDIRKLEVSVPCPIPEEARELFQYARAFGVPNFLKGPHRLLTEIDL